MTQVATSAEVSNAIKTVYGYWGLGHYDNMADERPLTPENQLVTEFRQDPCSQHTTFFRHRGLLEGFVTYTLPGLLKEDGAVSATQIGATGEEAWSLSTLLHQKRTSYRITGYNTNQSTLDSVYGPFDVTIDEINRFIANWVDKTALEECLEDTPKGVRPRPLITDRVTFARHDILDGPVPGEKANTLVINNVLWHYPEETRGHIMANALAGLRSGGALLFEGWTADSRLTPGYADWVRDLDQRGLFPYHDRSVNSVLKYVPEAAVAPFEQSAAVNEALGVLAAVQEAR